MAEATDSILDMTKKALGIDSDYTAFDIDVVMHINSVFLTLNQLGVGPLEGFAIQDSETTWEEYTVDDLNLNAVKSYMYLRVRLLFDPPTTSFTIEAMDKQVKELEWRLCLHMDPPLPTILSLEADND